MSHLTAVRAHHRAPAGRHATALLLATTGILLLWFGAHVRVAEAWLQTAVLDLVGVPSAAVGETVMVRLSNGNGVGIRLTQGCSVAPLLSVFLLGAAPFVWYRQIPWQRVLAAVAQLAVVLVVANQLRISVIVAAMHWWGIHRGYEVSHVFLGSTITTIGFVLGAILFVRLLMRRERP